MCNLVLARQRNLPFCCKDSSNVFSIRERYHNLRCGGIYVINDKNVINVNGSHMLHVAESRVISLGHSFNDHFHVLFQ